MTSSKISIFISMTLTFFLSIYTDSFNSTKNASFYTKSDWGWGGAENLVNWPE
jgi:hypothetical protein